VPLVITFDRLDRTYDAVQRGESKESLPYRQNISEAGVLVYYRPPRSEVGRRSVAEPSRSEPYVLILSHGELATRPGDVLAINVDVQG
jgi:hypothetical protein